MLKVTNFVERDLPGLNVRLVEQGFSVTQDDAEPDDDTIIVLTLGEAAFYRRFANLLVFCKTEEDVRRAELRTYVAFRYDWELTQYLRTPISRYEGSYLMTGFLTCRIGLHACMKGWRLLSVPSVNVTYIHQDPIDASREKAYYSIPCFVKNALVDAALDLVCDKAVLYTKVKKYIPETEPLERFKFKRGVYIAKPAGSNAYSGAGITIIRSAGDLTEAKKKIRENRAWKGIVSRYINNPLLFRGRKFHVRVYMLVTSAGTYSVFARSHIFTAQLQYIHKNYDKSYTDSHGATTEEDWELERDFVEADATLLRKKIEDVCAEIWDVIKNEVRCYPESKYGYEVISPDVMFDTDLNPWLLEVNRKVGLASSSKTPELYANFTYAFYQWVFQHGIEPFLALR